MRVRLIRPEEWAQLAPVFDAEGGVLPPPESGATAAVAFDDQGLAGFWVVQPCWHVGPLWVRPEYRGKGLWRRLSAVVDALFQRQPGTGYYSFSDGPRMDAVFAKLDYQRLGYQVWKREVK